MAFDYFAAQKIDMAESRLVWAAGWILNVITPVLSVITNISFDHKDILGDTLEDRFGEGRVLSRTMYR